MKPVTGFRQQQQVNPKIAIIGAGPAGLSCALWLSNMGCHPVLLERASQSGGMLRFNHHVNDWLLGFPRATGHALKDRFMEHLLHRNTAIITSALPTSIGLEEKGFSIAFTASAQQHRIDTDFLVIASGTRPRAPMGLMRLAANFPDRVFIGTGELCVDDFAPEKHIAIFGGGDNAFENAYHLAARGSKVDIYCRSLARARREWIERCKTLPNILLHHNTITSQYAANGSGVSFLANDAPIEADVIAVMYGYEPNADTLKEIAPWLEPTINQEGFIRVNEYQQTQIPHLYAIGDVTDRPLPCLPSAIGQGSVAAKAIMLDAEGMLP